MEDRHSTQSRKRFYAEFHAALRAIEKLPPPRPKPIVDVRLGPNGDPRPETEQKRAYPEHQQALRMPYYSRMASYGKLRDTTTDYNESMFMARNLNKAAVS